MNKIDLKNANPDAVAVQMKTLFEFEREDILRVLYIYLSVKSQFFDLQLFVLIFRFLPRQG